jgi:hypothetical protein
MRTLAPSRRAALLLLAAAPLAGCASMFTGTKDPMKFDANVPGVRLSIDGRYLGELPLALDMSRNFIGGEQFWAKFERDGYETQEFKLRREFNTVAILDISSPLTCGGIDILTGALMRFSPTEYHVTMRPLAPAGSGTVTGLERDLAIRRFVVASAARIQADLARGGGEHLGALGVLVAGGDPVRARLVVEAALRDAPALVAAPTAHAFAERLAPALGLGGEAVAVR